MTRIGGRHSRGGANIEYSDRTGLSPKAGSGFDPVLLLCACTNEVCVDGCGDV